MKETIKLSEEREAAEEQGQRNTEKSTTVAGVVGGDIGEGTMTGDAFDPVEVLPDGSVTFEAEYRLVGSKHSLTVRFRSVQAPDTVAWSSASSRTAGSNATL